jgi:hypothetical protein
MNNVIEKTIPTGLWNVGCYNSVKENKTAKQKDELIIEMYCKSLTGALNNKTAKDTCQDLTDILYRWCSNDVRVSEIFAHFPYIDNINLLNEAQINLLYNLKQIDEVNKICILKIEPEFDIVIVSDNNDMRTFDSVSKLIANYEIKQNANVSYVCFSQDEFEKSCIRKPIIQIEK